MAAKKKTKGVAKAAGNMREMALFDLDFTLIPHDTMFLFANFVLKKQRRRLFYLAVFLPLVPLAAFKWVGILSLKSAFFSFLWGLSREQLDELAAEFVRTEVEPRLFPEVREEVRRQKELGRTVVLNTASPGIYIEAIAKLLDFDYWFATPMILPTAGSGARLPLFQKFSGPNNKGVQKIVAMRQAGLLAPVDDPRAEQERVRFAASDSTADLPMLEMAEEGLLIDPSIAKFQKKTGRDPGADSGRFSDWTIWRPRAPYSGVVGKYSAAMRQLLGLYPHA